MQPPSSWRVAQVPRLANQGCLGDQKKTPPVLPLPNLRQCPKLSSPQHLVTYPYCPPPKVLSMRALARQAFENNISSALPQSRPKSCSEPLPSAPTQAPHCGGREQGCISRDNKCFQESSRSLPALFGRQVAQSSFASMSCFAIGVRLSISSPRAARTGLMCGGTSWWFR